MNRTERALTLALRYVLRNRESITCAVIALGLLAAVVWSGTKFDPLWFFYS